MSERENVTILIDLFNRTFADFNTRLVLGDDEPLYSPADEHYAYHRIIFAHGYFSSALHEIAHWCIAGSERRQRVDYGYWYAPDGRDQVQQKQFEQVEIKPQAIEWAFSLAAGHKFRVSTDNLNGAQPDTQAFTRAVHAQLCQYLEQGFPQRAERFISVLHNTFATSPLQLNTLDEVAA